MVTSWANVDFLDPPITGHHILPLGGASFVSMLIPY